MYIWIDQLRMSGTIMDKAPVGLERTTGRVGWGSCGQLHHFSKGRKRSVKGDSYVFLHGQHLSGHRFGT